MSDDTKKVALVTGGNAGIGFETCKGLLQAGFHVVVCARSVEKGEAAVNQLCAEGPAGATAEALVMDLASLDSVRDAASHVLETGRPLSVCVLNAGIMALPWRQTVDGFEQQWQVNVLGHALLCRLLLPAIESATAPAGRIIHLSSGAHRRHPQPIDHALLAAEHTSDKDFDRWYAYGRSKLANILFSNELSRRLAASGSAVTSNALHPGLVSTNLLTNAGGDRSRGIPASEGAKTSIYLATSPDVEGQSGGYYFQCAPVSPGRRRTEISTSAAEGRRLWTSICHDLGLDEAL